MAIEEVVVRHARVRRISSERVNQWSFFGIAALLFAASTVVTVLWCASMSAMGEMAMPGGWTMSMAWMRMPDQTWAGLGASFLGMWLVMTAAMMLPSLTPMLWRYRQAIGAINSTQRNWLISLASAGYFCVWTAVGLIGFAVGVAMSALAMQLPSLARAIPSAVGLVVLVAGMFQCTAWKRHHLACCRTQPESWPASPASSGTAWRHGLRLGLHCSYCCAALTTTLLVVGMMDLRTMLLVTLAITVERFAPAGQRVALAIGAIIVCAGLVLLARAVAFG